MDAQLPRRGGGCEVLDEDFFMYKEDVDLAWRLRLLGLEDALRAGGHRLARADSYGGRLRPACHRALQPDDPALDPALSWRNQRLMQIKNERVGGFLRDLPWILRRELLSVGFMVVADPLRLSAIPATLRAVPSAVRKRHALNARLAERADLQVAGTRR